MYVNNLEQLLRFIYFMLVGMVLSLVFDIFRVLRRSFKTPDILTNIEDALFGFITGIILLAAIFWLNNGQLRFYILISLVSGIFIYIVLISKYFIRFNVFIIQQIKKIIVFLFTPFRILFSMTKKAIYRPVFFLFINIKHFGGKIEKFFKKISKRQKKSTS